jgi:hypothetical protein
MTGEFCREAAVLIFVFANLDFWLKPLKVRIQNDSDDPVTYTLKVFGISVAFQITGMCLEKWRKS